MMYRFFYSWIDKGLFILKKITYSGFTGNSAVFIMKLLMFFINISYFKSNH